MPSHIGRCMMFPLVMFLPRTFKVKHILKFWSEVTNERLKLPCKDQLLTLKNTRVA